MSTTRRAITMAAALLAMFSLPSSLSAQSKLGDRVSAAIEAIRGACASDIDKFCGNVSPGEGRVLLCMQAHDDQLGFRCQFALYRASRHLGRALNRVERIADACWSDIQARCANAESTGLARCVMDQGRSLSRSCQKAVTGVRRGLQGFASLRGMPAYSADGRDLGRVVDVVRGPDGKVQAISVEVGRFLGIGNRVVTVDRDAFEQLAGRIRLRINGDDVRSLPEAGTQ
jgi:PRC-barrel domain protein/cysteine rich repeat protein